MNILLQWWREFWTDFWQAAKETPGQFFYPLVWTWKKIRGTKLNHCPKCGSRAKLVKHPWEEKYRVECKNCDKIGKASCVKEVAKLQWNIENNENK